MDNADNYIKHFTAADIEKYHRGQLSSQEMHALEKAALDDPFLADALEGYTVPGVNATADIAELKARLAEKTSKNKVIAMPRSGRSFFWLRAAAMIIALAGALFLTYRFVFDKKENAGLAQSAKPQTTDSNSYKDIVGQNSKALLPAGDSIEMTSVPKALDSASTYGFTTGATANQFKTQTNHLTIPSDSVSGAIAYRKDIPKQGEAEFKVNNAVVQKAPVVIPPASAASGNRDDMAKNAMADRDGVKNQPNKKSDTSKAENFMLEDVGVVAKRQENNTLNRKVAATTTNNQPENREKTKAGNEYYKNMYTYRGVIRDANNHVLPFAKVTNVADGVGTYADANGRFNLTSLDTSLNLQVKATGFTNYTAFLKKSNPTNNTIILEEDKSIPEQTLQTQKLNYARRSRSADANMKLEGEPEPEDGWENYDSYLSNNRNIPETMLKEKSGPQQIVEVSFEVNREGEPVNFKIEKSLGTRFDEEAIRLIKEGPKWKRKARKGRTTVAISF